MAQNDFTLAWILPYVREALKQTSNFEFRTYANALFMQLEKAQVHGVVRFSPGSYSGGQTFQYEAMPSELRALVSEAFFHIFHKGYIAPAAPDAALNPPHLHMFNVTQRGRVWFQGEEPLPEDAERYLKFLRARVPAIDPIIEQYIIEALTSFERESYFASAVMLGAASEKELYLLAEAVLLALKEPKKQSKLKGLLDRRRLLELFETVRDTINGAIAAKLLPYSDSEGSSTHLMSLYEAIRVQRNDAVHPMNAIVSEDSVRLLLLSFPYTISKSEELRAWFVANPASI
ncbi:MAG: hypothetical protein ABR910_16115 [Acidobacteriaceae bacterium]|jgi:hypothetical protein